MTVSKKVAFLDSCFFSKFRGISSDSSIKDLKVCSRNSFVCNHWVGSSVSIYNGYKFKPVLLKSQMVGHSFGELSLTKIISNTRISMHSSRKKKKKKGKSIL